MVELITWPSFFEPIKIGVFGDFLVHSYQGVVQNYCLGKPKMVEKGFFGKQNLHLFFGGFWLHFIVAL